METVLTLWLYDIITTYLIIKKKPAKCTVLYIEKVFFFCSGPSNPRRLITSGNAGILRPDRGIGRRVCGCTITSRATATSAVTCSGEQA